MPILTPRIIIFSLIFSGCVIPTYLGKFSLNEIQVNKTEAKISRVLFVGAGSTSSRLFLESLSPYLINIFSRSNIHCDFTYAGKIPRRSHLDVEKLVSTEYDSYLILNPMDTAYIDTHKKVAEVGTPLPGGNAASGSVIGNQYIEDFNVELYTTHNSLSRVWQAELKVNFDLANQGKYEKIAKDIFKILFKNGFVTKK